MRNDMQSEREFPALGGFTHWLAPLFPVPKGLNSPLQFFKLFLWRIGKIKKNKDYFLYCFIVLYLLSRAWCWNDAHRPSSSLTSLSRFVLTDLNLLEIYTAHKRLSARQQTKAYTKFTHTLSFPLRIKGWIKRTGLLVGVGCVRSWQRLWRFRGNKMANSCFVCRLHLATTTPVTLLPSA